MGAEAEVPAGSEHEAWIADPSPADLIETLQERGERYGLFSGCAEISQALKITMRTFQGGTPWEDKLNDSQREALAMIAHKIGRILNGDPNYVDTWTDIAGYALLIEKQLLGDGM